MNPLYATAFFRAAVPPGGWPIAFAIITGFNPNGKNANAAQNLEFDRRLTERLIADRYWHWRVTGGSPDFRHAEPGFAIALPLQTALAIGGEFEQEAIFWIEEDELSVLACRGETRQMLGSWRKRLADLESLPPDKHQKDSPGAAWTDGELKSHKPSEANRIIFDSLLSSLNGREIIYREKITRLIRVSKVRTDDEGFSAEAVSLARIEAWGVDRVSWRSWQFGSSWDTLGFAGRAITAAFGGWTLYTDPHLVARVAELLSDPDCPNLRIRTLLMEYAEEPFTG